MAPSAQRPGAALSPSQLASAPRQQCLCFSPKLTSVPEGVSLSPRHPVRHSEGGSVSIYLKLGPLSPQSAGGADSPAEGAGPNLASGPSPAERAPRVLGATASGRQQLRKLGTAGEPRRHLADIMSETPWSVEHLLEINQQDAAIPKVTMSPPTPTKDLTAGPYNTLSCLPSSGPHNNPLQWLLDCTD